MYADDTVLLTESPDDLQIFLNRMQEYCTLYDLKLNSSKTKVNWERHTCFTLAKKPLKLWMNTIT